jgi:hypothetical protein
MLRRELIFLHSASGDGCNDRPLLLATQEDFYRPVALTRFLHSVHTIPALDGGRRFPYKLGALKCQDNLVLVDPLSIEALAEANRLHPKVVRQALRLAFLSPGVTSAILEGRQPARLSLAQIPKLLRTLSLCTCRRQYPV